MTAKPSASPKRHAVRAAVRRLILGALALVNGSGSLAHAGAHPGLELPLDCVPGKSCWIVNYVDLDAGKGAADYRCGRLSYDGHKGTDFAIRDLGVMAEGVAVRAAAAGVVTAIRDGEPDRNARADATGTADGRECGNGVRIEHGDGLATQYCHLRRGSVAVQRGQRVSAGDALGLVGMSGETEFPHLHLSVYRGGAVIDPFTGRSDAEGCGAGAARAWAPAVQQALPYARRQIYHLGLAGEPPVAERVRAGDYGREPVRGDAPVLAVWMEAFGVAVGDTVRLELVAPDGTRVVTSDTAIEKDLARVFRWAGKRRGSTPWPAGSYRIAVDIRPADGSAPARAAATVELRG